MWCHCHVITMNQRDRMVQESQRLSVLQQSWIPTTRQSPASANPSTTATRKQQKGSSPESPWLLYNRDLWLRRLQRVVVEDELTLTEQRSFLQEAKGRLLVSRID